MNKKEFIDIINDMVITDLATSDNNITVELHDVIKNNGLILTGLIIKDANTNIAPTIYLDDFYSRFSDGLLSLEDTVSEIIKIYMQHKRNSITLDWIQDFEKVKDKIIPCICNTNLNTSFLEEHPSTTFLDLSIYYRIQLSTDILEQDDATATIAITNQLADTWGISPEELNTIAFENAATISPSSFKTMFEVLGEMIPDTDTMFDAAQALTPMYVLSNSSKVDGAVWMANKDVLESIANLLSDNFYLLPSSKNETIIIPSSVSQDEESLKSMIREVSDSEVSKTDFLSYSLYKYDKSSHELMIA